MQKISPSTAVANTNSALAVEVEKINASIGKKQILHDITFSIPAGKLISILGPNGAGKTTLIRVMTGGIPATSGSVKIENLEIKRNLLKIKRYIGITAQDNNIYENLSASENLRLHGMLFGMSDKQIRQRTDEVLQMVDLLDRKKDAVRKFSGGMKRRLVIARSIFHNPAVVFLDEPTTGLDPEARQSIWKMIHSLKEQQVSLLLTTHYMEEAENLSDNVIVMNNGHIITQGTTKDLLAEHVGIAFVEFSGLTENDTERLKTLIPQTQVVNPGHIRISISDLSEVSGIIRLLESNNIPFATISTRQSTLEDVFFKFTGRNIEQ
jgi:ABC-type multidrug transport system ATPase subunit